MGNIIILPETTTNPITLIGQRAGVCWGADITDDDKNYRRGLDCIQSGHGRTLEFVNVEMILDGYSARVIREWYTHIGGAPTRLQASTRYINYGNFEYIVPPSIENNADALKEYIHCMDHIAFAARKLESIDIPREDAAMLLPLGMNTAQLSFSRDIHDLMKFSFWFFDLLCQQYRLCHDGYAQRTCSNGDEPHPRNTISEQKAACFFPEG